MLKILSVDIFLTLVNVYVNKPYGFCSKYLYDFKYIGIRKYDNKWWYVSAHIETHERTE